MAHIFIHNAYQWSFICLSDQAMHALNTQLAMSQQKADVLCKSQPIVTVLSSEQPSRPLLATLGVCALVMH